MPSRSLVVKITAGKDDPERCNQAFTVAATAVAAGLDVSLWLTGEAAWLALPGRAGDIVLPYAAPLGDLLASILAAGPPSSAGDRRARGYARARVRAGRCRALGRRTRPRCRRRCRRRG